MNVYESRFIAQLKLSGYDGPVGMNRAVEWAVENLTLDQLRKLTLHVFGVFE